MTSTTRKVSTGRTTRAPARPPAEGFPPSERRLRITIIPPPAPRATFLYPVNDDRPPTDHPTLVPSGDDFPSRARLLQSVWRERQGLAIGKHRGVPLGTRLAMPAARHHLSNYLTATVRTVVRREVLDPVRSLGKLFAKPGIFNDLLSSQPLSFNLFAELQQDLRLASRVFSRLTLGRMADVRAIGFEHGPGRGLATYTGNRSAFDVFVEYVTQSGDKGFAGIEVMYYESRDPINPIKRGHLLADSLRLDRGSGYSDGFFALLYPEQNECCERGVNRYAAGLTNRSTFARWTLETIVAAIKAEGADVWIDTFADRYLGFY
jgi:hypothetical protein